MLFRSHGLSANKKVAKKGGEVAGIARTDLEEKLGETIISKDNALNYKYIDDRKTITNQDEVLFERRKASFSF